MSKPGDSKYADDVKEKTKCVNNSTDWTDLSMLVLRRWGTIELAGRLSPQLVKIQRGSIESQSQSESQQMKSFPRDRMFSVVIAILHSINQITNYQLNVKR